ncbi:MAG: hypothetical protein J1F16_02090 [Muribaculaceae bacterium]|nr:hypothetical protein [Muribaculaceae bacterium]
MKTNILSILAVVLLAACSHKATVSDQKASEEFVPSRVAGIGSQAVYPNATAFRMSGNYQDNVAVSINPEGELIYFPAPTDITADSRPIALGEGWWLNCQGLGPNSVFTTYTFEEYASLPQVPSPEQIKNAIIPGAKVTGFVELPIKLGAAIENIELAKKSLPREESAPIKVD